MVRFVKMRVMKRCWLPLLALSALIAGCNGGKEGGGFSDRKSSGASSTLKYCLSNNPTTLDPAKVQDIDTMDVLADVYEPLVNYDESNKIVGILASEWKVSDDGLTYTFKLKPAKFHDGSPVTANDVKASWERALSKEVNSPIADTYLGDIVGAKEFAAGKAPEVSGIDIIDPQTLAVSIDKPRPYFLGKLTYPCCDVLPAKLGKKEVSGISDGIGTGPFQFDKYETEQRLLLKRNESYYGEKASIEAIERPIVKDPATRLIMFQNNQTDMLTLEKQDWKKVQDDPKLKPLFQTLPRPAIYYLLLGGKAYEPFRDVHVRRAVMQAIDRKRICDQILKGSPIANRWLPEGILDGKPSQTALPFDPEAAKREMALSSYKTGSALPALELAIRADNSDAKFLAEQVANDLKANLGMKVQPRAMEWASLLKARNRGELDFVFLSWFGDYIDAQNFLSTLMVSNAPANYDHWSNAEFDKLCNEADLEKDPTKRKELYLKAEDIILTEVPRVPMYHGVDGILVSSRVSGLRYNLLGSLPHNKVVLK